MEQPPSKEARGPINLRIKFRSESIDQFIERYSIDVSRGGIFIRTREPLAVGTQLKFDFQLQDAAPLMAGEGTVVWIREYDPNRAGVTPGMGVRFDKLTPTSQPVLEKILAEKGRRDQNTAVSPGTASKMGAGMAVRRASSTFTALDPALTGSGPASLATGAAPAARAAVPLERTNSGYQPPATAGAPPQMTLPLSPPPRPMTPGGLPTLESALGRPAGTGTSALLSRLTPTNAAKYEPPSSADIDKALDGLTPGGDVAAAARAAGATAARAAGAVAEEAASGAEEGAPTGMVDPMSEPTQLADRLPDFFASTPTRLASDARVGGNDQPHAQPHAAKPSLDAPMTETPAPEAAATAVAAVAAGMKDKVAALETPAAPAGSARSSAKTEAKPAPKAGTAPPASKRPTALIIGGLVAAVAVVVVATNLSSSDRQQEGLAKSQVEQPHATPPPLPPAPEPVPVPPPAPQAPAAAAEPVPAPPTPPPAAAEPATAPATAEAEIKGEARAETKKLKAEPTITKSAKVAPAPAPARKVAAVAAKKPTAPGEPSPQEPAAAKPSEDANFAPTPEAEIAQSLLKITSTPAGADVLLDGKSVGKTPYQGKQIDFSAPHAVTVKLDGYEPYEHMIGASDWTKAKNNVQSARVAVKLRKAAGATAAPKAEATKPEADKSQIGPPAVEVLTPEPVKPESFEPKKIETPPPNTP